MLHRDWVSYLGRCLRCMAINLKARVVVAALGTNVVNLLCWAARFRHSFSPRRRRTDFIHEMHRECVSCRFRCLCWWPPKLMVAPQANSRHWNRRLTATLGASVEVSTRAGTARPPPTHCAGISCAATAGDGDGAIRSASGCTLAAGLHG